MWSAELFECYFLQLDGKTGEEQGKEMEDDGVFKP